MRFGFSTLRLRLRSLFRRAEVDQELEDELCDHLEQKTQHYITAGLNAENARRRARIDLDGIELRKEQCRDARRTSWLHDALQDSLHALRNLRKSPASAVFVILTLALGVGANTAIFSVIKAVLFDPLPYRQPDHLVSVAPLDPETRRPTNVSFGEAADWRSRSRSFQEIALYRGWSPSSSGQGAPELVYALRVTQNFFETLGIAPYLGRGFEPEEDRPNRWHVVLLSYPYWASRFARDPRAIGQTLLLDQTPFQIVGVLPKSFNPLSFTDAGSPPDIWAPLGYDLSLPDACRTCRHLRTVARLNDGVNLPQAQAEMNSISLQLAREFPKEYPPDAQIFIETLRESWYGSEKRALWLLWGATVFVLLIACANVANLLLGQAVRKRREVAVRSALGASRLRIIRQLLTESVLTGLLGGVAGVSMAFWGMQLLIAWAPEQLPRTEAIRLDSSVLLVALSVSMITGILMGLVPAVQASRVGHREAMQQSSRSVIGTGSGAQRFLVIAEVGLAFLLAVSAGLLLKSFARAWHVDPGFNATNVYEVNFSLIGRRFESDSAVVRAQTEILDRIRRLPGIDSVALVSTPPLSGAFGALDQAGLIIQDRRLPDPQVPSVDRYYVSPDYFRVMQIPVLRGRAFTQADAFSGNPVAVISQTAARQMWPDEDPIGKRIELGARNDAGPWAAIVGIVGDVHQYGLDVPTTPQAYILYTQYPFNYATVLTVRSSLSASALTPSIEEQIRAVEKGTLIFNPALMTEILSHSLARRRFAMSLLAVFGGLALFLAALGIYGVMSYGVAQRTNEIGVRMALGAQRSHVLRLIVGGGLGCTIGGLVLGFAGSLAFGHLLSKLLFEVSPADPGVLFLSCSVLGAVALGASYFPARRATRVDPTVALRYE